MAAKLVLVGAGKMGGALLAGLLANNWASEAELCVIEYDATRRGELAARYPHVQLLSSPEAGITDSAGGAILAVKPDQAEAVAKLVAATGIDRIISVVAGLSTHRLEIAAPGARIVRVMPNTGALVGQAVSVISGGETVTAQDLDWASSIFSAVGTVKRLPERQMDAVTGLSGSGPAYLFLVAESMIDAGVLAGLSREVASDLVTQTFVGAAALMAEGSSTPEHLRAAVTSPAGTTAAGLRILELKAVRSAFIEAVATAVERSRQLGH